MLIFYFCFVFVIYHICAEQCLQNQNVFKLETLSYPVSILKSVLRLGEWHKMNSLCLRFEKSLVLDITVSLYDIQLPIFPHPYFLWCYWCMISRHTNSVHFSGYITRSGPNQFKIEFHDSPVFESKIIFAFWKKKNGFKHVE